MVAMLNLEKLFRMGNVDVVGIVLGQLYLVVTEKKSIEAVQTHDWFLDETERVPYYFQIFVVAANGIFVGIQPCPHAYDASSPMAIVAVVEKVMANDYISYSCLLEPVTGIPFHE